TILSRQVGCSEMQTALETAALQCRPGRRLFAGQMLIRIEDLNLPKLGALELLRGFVDQRGLRNSKDDTWLRGEGIHLVASSAAPGLTGQGAEPGPPGSQSGLLMPRLARHFVELFVPEPAEEDVKKIFMEVSRQILQVNGAGDGLVAAFSAHQEGSSSARRYKVEDALALATLHLSKLMKDVLRQHAPARLGMTSLRDVARLLQGVARAAPHHFTEKIQLAKLWAHEVRFRIFTAPAYHVADLLRRYPAGKLDFDKTRCLSVNLDFLTADIADDLTAAQGICHEDEYFTSEVGLGLRLRETYFGMEPALEGLSFRLDTSSGQYVDSDSQETRLLDSLTESWIADLMLTVDLS
ncbi:DNAH6, partial [Symbiodinium sp. KB8]